VLSWLFIEPSTLNHFTTFWRFEKSDAVTDTRKDVLPLTADLTTAELAEALGALRFHGQSHCLVSLDKDVRDYLLRAIRVR
jgi:hypothetical protein